MERNVGNAGRIALLKGISKSGFLGYFGNRFRAWWRKPDMDYVTYGLYIGGKTSQIPEDFKVINIQNFPEAEYFDPIRLYNMCLWIRLFIEERNRVFVHCRHGRGRAFLVAVAYIMYVFPKKYLENMDVDSAIEYVKNQRPYTCMNSDQRKVLDEFYERYIK